MGVGSTVSWNRSQAAIRHIHISGSSVVGERLIVPKTPASASARKPASSFAYMTQGKSTITTSSVSSIPVTTIYASQRLYSYTASPCRLGRDWCILALKLRCLHLSSFKASTLWNDGICHVSRTVNAPSLRPKRGSSGSLGASTSSKLTVFTLCGSATSTSSKNSGSGAPM